ncbi:unnamed protein product, partial [Prorocentrum cordatum]
MQDFDVYVGDLSSSSTGEAKDVLRVLIRGDRACHSAMQCELDMDKVLMLLRVALFEPEGKAGAGLYGTADRELLELRFCRQGARHAVPKLCGKARDTLFHRLRGCPCVQAERQALSCERTAQPGSPPSPRGGQVSVGSHVVVREGRHFSAFDDGDQGVVLRVDPEAQNCHVLFAGRSEAVPVALRHLRPVSSAGASSSTPRAGERRGSRTCARPARAFLLLLVCLLLLLLVVLLLLLLL